MRLSRQAHDREICRRHFEAHLALWWNRALPPPFFFIGGTQHPLPVYSSNYESIAFASPSKELWELQLNKVHVYCMLLYSCAMLFMRINIWPAQPPHHVRRLAIKWLGCLGASATNLKSKTPFRRRTISQKVLVLMLPVTHSFLQLATQTDKEPGGARFGAAHGSTEWWNTWQQINRRMDRRANLAVCKNIYATSRWGINCCLIQSYWQSASHTT